VHIDGVSDHGLKAHFDRVVYRCTNGREVEAAADDPYVVAALKIGFE